MKQNARKPTIGLALGSGSARGWAHIGVIRELNAIGIKPSYIAGTSIGSLVGAAYACNELDKLERWILKLNKKEIFRYLDIKLVTGGGFIEGKKLFEFLRRQLGDRKIEDLDTQYGCIATELSSGREIWFKKGSLLDAVRASIAIPGVFTPVKHGEQWLIDGAVSNPIPVSLCRAMGAELIIAINLNNHIAGKPLANDETRLPKKPEPTAETTILDKLANEFTNKKQEIFGHFFEGIPNTPGLFDVISTSVNIMQDKITRSRMAGDPPDILLTPKLTSIGLMEFDKAQEAIEEGRNAVRRAFPTLQDIFSV